METHVTTDTGAGMGGVRGGRPHVRRLIHGSVFLLVLAGVLAGLSVLLSPRTPTVTLGEQYPAVRGYALLPADTIDAFFVGDSSAQGAISPQVFEEKTGMSSFNASCPIQKSVESVELVEDMFRYQSPKVVVYEVNNLYRDTSVTRDVRTRAEQLIPVLRYHTNWKKLLSGSLFAPAEMPTTERGFRPSDRVKAYTGGDYMADDGSTKELTRMAKVYLRQMEQTCRAHGARLVLVSVPNAQEWSAAKDRAVSAWAQENGVDYYDLNLASAGVGIDWLTDTRDGGMHLNSAGARKATTWLAARLA